MSERHPWAFFLFSVAGESKLHQRLQESQSYIRDYLLRHVFKPLCLRLKFFCAWANGGSASASQ